ncbi:MAG: hypothetical protein Ct9H300mP32_3680 [Verrucomicrobiota bacterium]|nr:MAG: hypothetical protein Ct9H300mP32_3680 [Verrucomicrobiota bacterium]
MVDGRLCGALAEQTQLSIIGVSGDAGKVAAARERLAGRGIYGRRVSVHLVEGGALRLPIISLTSSSPKGPVAWPGAESLWAQKRKWGVCCNHITVLPGWSRTLCRTWLAVCPAQASGRTSTATRPILATAATHLCTAILCCNGSAVLERLQWWTGIYGTRTARRGGQTNHPRRKPSRSRWTPTTEKELWRLPLPGSQRYSMPYDAGYMSVNDGRLFVAVADEARLINLARGKVEQTFPVSEFVPGERRHWGHAVLADRRIFGTAQRTTASRTKPSRDLINVDYNNNQAMVTGTHLFSAPLDGGRLGPGKWKHEGGTILNPTITLSGDRVFFVKTTKPVSGSGRHSLDVLRKAGLQIVCLDAETGDGFGRGRWTKAWSKAGIFCSLRHREII